MKALIIIIICFLLYNLAGAVKDSKGKKNSAPKTMPGKASGSGYTFGSGSKSKSADKISTSLKKAGSPAIRLPKRSRKPMTDLYKLEDRNNDWLARQIREESNSSNYITREIMELKLKRRKLNEKK